VTQAACDRASSVQRLGDGLARSLLLISVSALEFMKRRVKVNSGYCWCMGGVGVKVGVMKRMRGSGSDELEGPEGKGPR
jgi:hypothetical protein